MSAASASAVRVEVDALLTRLAYSSGAAISGGGVCVGGALPPDPAGAAIYVNDHGAFAIRDARGILLNYEP